MIKVFLFVSVLVMSCALKAQNAGIVLKNKVSGEEVFIPSGQKIAIVTQSDKFSKGVYSILGDDRILVDNDTLAVADIKEVKQRMKGTMITGAIIKVASGAVVLIGIGYAVAARSTTMAFPAMIAALIGGGGMWIHSIYQTYQIDEWDVSLRR